MKRRTYSFLLIIIGLSIVGVLVLYFGQREIVMHISQLSLSDFFLLFVVQVTILVLSATKWWIILGDKTISYKSVLSISLIGYLVNGLTPIAGGEPVRAYLISKIENVSSQKAFSSVFVDFFLAVTVYWHRCD